MFEKILRKMNNNSIDSFYFKSLSNFSLCAIEKMINENYKFYIYITYRIDNSENYKNFLFKMLNDSSNFFTYDQFNINFNTSYLYKNINYYFKNLVTKIKPILGNSQYERVMKEICKNIEKYTLRKVNIGYYEKNNEFDRYVEIDELISDEINFIADSVLTFITICKIVFIEKQINNLNKEDELYKIIINMSKEVDDFDIVFNKTYPIYSEFYMNNLGNLDKENYKLAVFIIFNNLQNKFKNHEDYKDLSDVNDNLLNSIEKWIDTLISREIILDDITPYLFEFIKYNYVLNDKQYLILLYNIKKFKNKYNSKLEIYRATEDRKRYIKGDFSKEKASRAFKFNLASVENGSDFELFLENVFRQLNYKVKRCGKSGDQGGDLLVKKDDITYIIQAKFYSNHLDNTPVQEVLGSIRFYNANRGVVITNNKFTKGAKELANINKVILIDGEKLEELINKIYEKEDYDFLEDFIDF